jgi:hypothetical protein
VSADGPTPPPVKPGFVIAEGMGTKTLRRLSLLGLLLGLLILLAPASAAEADRTGQFFDPNLEAAVRDAIGKPSGDIREADLLSLTTLNANSRDIIHLHGLEHCTSLTSLSLWDNQITDLSPLSYLMNLGQLSLGSNDITDISPLCHLGSLESLWLPSNHISDVSPLAGLTNLALLDLSENQIGDITPLSRLTGLTELYLRQNLIENVSAISGLTRLNRLWLSHNQVYDISPLADNEGLGEGDTISLSHNPMSPNSVRALIPELQRRGANVISTTVSIANPDPSETKQASFNVWIVVGLLLALVAALALTYYFILLRRGLRKRKAAMNHNPRS